VTDDLRPWTILMLSAGALFTGGLVWYAWERVWIWRRQLRRRWRRFHLARTSLGLAALVCLITAVAYAPPSQGGT
jgi:drug/metabolite transporter (DMT)-like permease